MPDDPFSFALPSSTLIAACLTNNGIKDVPTTKKRRTSRQQMTIYMLNDDLLSDDSNLVVSIAQFATNLFPTLLIASLQIKSAIRDGSRI